MNDAQRNIALLGRSITLLRRAVMRGDAQKHDVRAPYIVFQHENLDYVNAFRRACHELGGAQLGYAVTPSTDERHGDTHTVVYLIPEWPYIDLMRTVHNERDWQQFGHDVLHWASVEAMPHTSFNLN